MPYSAAKMNHRSRPSIITRNDRQAVAVHHTHTHCRATTAAGKAHVRYQGIAVGLNSNSHPKTGATSFAIAVEGDSLRHTRHKTKANNKPQTVFAATSGVTGECSGRTNEPILRNSS